MQTQTEDAVKLCLAGSYNTGKTSIINRLTKNEFVSTDSTIGADFIFHSIQVEDEAEKLNLYIWDTAGQERFRSLLPMYYKDSNCSIIVYDITNVESYNDALRLLKKIDKLKSKEGENKESDIVIALVGNKCDLDSNRAVERKEAEDAAGNFKAIFMETSAKTGVNVNKLFYSIAVECKERNLHKLKQHGISIIQNDKKKESNKCCNS